jgi:Fe-S cluster assembly scaffold protein SufB
MRTVGRTERLAEIETRARGAHEKVAPLGPDLDLDVLGDAVERDRVKSLASLERQMQEVALEVGVDPTEQSRAGSYFQVDRSAVYRRVEELYERQVEILSTQEALDRYDGLSEYWWRLVDPAKDKYTSLVARGPWEGYFIRVREGQRLADPVQSCLLVAENNVSQNVHNVVILEQGAEAHIITGCTIHPGVDRGLHTGISEFFIGEGARLTFTMIHNWGERFDVRPRTAVTVADDGVFINNYILLRPVRSIQTYPTCRLQGARSRAVFTSIAYGLEDSYVDIGSEIVLEGEGSRAESVARAAVRDRATLYSRGRLVARTNDVKAHLDCRGIVFSEGASMVAIPDLASEGAPRAELSHEAAISPIAAEEVYYLMARGLPRDEAISMITRGFLDLEIPGLPSALRARIDQALEETAKESL